MAHPAQTDSHPPAASFVSGAFVPALVALPVLSVDEVTDTYWFQAEPLLPSVALENLHKIAHPGAGRGRKPVHPRQIFRAIIYVIVHRISWYELPESSFGLSYGTAAIAFRRWSRDGFFARLHKAGLAPHEQFEGIAWDWDKTKTPWEQVTLSGNTPLKPVKPRSRGNSRMPLSAAPSGADRAA